MKTAILVKGFISKQNPIIPYRLYHPVSVFKIRILDIILVPKYDSYFPNIPGQMKIKYKVANRKFTVTSNLVTRSAYDENQSLIEQQTPLIMFLKEMDYINPFMVENFDLDYFTVNNTTSYCQFIFRELSPVLKPDKDIAGTNYFYNVTIHLGLEIE